MRFVWLILALTLSLPFYGPIATGAQTKVHPEVYRALDQSPTGRASFIVLLDERPNLRSARSVRDAKARQRAVVRALYQTARRSQAPLIALLQAQRATSVTQFRSFFSVNALSVVGTREAVAELAAHPAVRAIEPNAVVAIPQPLGGPSSPKVSAVEPNIIQIKADLVWDLGFTGSGVVVANIDTGVRYTHEALVDDYLCGVDGPHENCWRDTVLGLATPYDDNNHGTHTMGTAVGGDGPGPFDNDIGVAPGAKWIACKAFNAAGSGTFAAIIGCSDFFLGLALSPETQVFTPHVISNSWGDDRGSTAFNAMVDAWNAAGISSSFALGNAGPACGTSGSPGEYTNAFGIGAVNASGVIAGFSSRGPASAANGGGIVPKVVAPGVGIRSATRVSDTSYAFFNGTSMATPHDAGLKALMLSKKPDLTVGELNNFTVAGAEPIVDLTCGGDESGIPNNIYGAGRINALNSVNLVPGGGHEPPPGH
jgi:subtilisin family serine protease